jgi:UDP-glucose 4-epimerase
MTLSSQFLGQKILVTGASGFIGSHLCRRLYRDGAEVHAISRIQHASDNHGLYWWQVELAETEAIRQLVRTIKPDVVFHLASHVVGARDLDLVMPTFRSNLLSTVNLFIAVSEIGCRRIVLTGSLEEPELESVPAIPSSPYAAAKWAASAYARMFYALYQLPVVILRVFMVYGPAQRDVRKLIPYVILSLLRGEAPQLTSGERQVDWIYVEDVVEGLLAAARTPNVEGQTIDIGSGELVPIRTIVEHLVRLINPQMQPLFGALPGRPLEQIRVANTANTAALMGWKPATSLEEGLKRTVHWYEERLRENVL